MRGLALMEQETIKWTDPPNTQHVHSLSCGAAAWAPIQVPLASLVFILWSPLASLPNSNGGGSQLGTADVINKRSVGPVDLYQQPKMCTRGGFACKYRYARVGCAALRWQEILFNCSIKGACFLSNCIRKGTFLIPWDDCSCHVTLRIER